MKLTKLLYNIVKNVVLYDDTSFTYTNFINGQFHNSSDYGTFINNMYAPLNEAISRLSDLGKLNNIVVDVQVGSDGIVLLSDELKESLKEVVNVVEISNGSYKILPYSMFDSTTIFLNEYSNNKTHKLEYKQDIPYFNSDYFTTTDEVDLKTYGITDSMCNYIIEYAQAKLLEQIEPNLANNHRIIAESYFNNINDKKNAFSQRVISHKYSI